MDQADKPRTPKELLSFETLLEQLKADGEENGGARVTGRILIGIRSRRGGRLTRGEDGRMHCLRELLTSNGAQGTECSRRESIRGAISYLRELAKCSQSFFVTKSSSGGSAHVPVPFSASTSGTGEDPTRASPYPQPSLVSS